MTSLRNYPGADPAALRAGSIVFTPPSSPAAMRFWGDWWRFTPGADYPVVHITYADASAYAEWAEKALPTEVEWEFAAGGMAETEFAWGADLTPGGVHMANTWQGRFPFENLSGDGFTGPSPVGTYPANANGLHDMIGNVWEWTADGWSAPVASSCCTPETVAIARKVIKGGLNLCAPNYCQRYRPAAANRRPSTAAPPIFAA